MRIATIVALTRMGVYTTARLDPLIPDVTDVDDSVLPLLRALAKAGGGRMIGLDERSRRFARLRALGCSAGVRIRPCRCKNPELADDPARSLVRSVARPGIARARAS